MFVNISKDSVRTSESALPGKFKNAFNGKLNDLISFFNSIYKGETFDCAFQGRKRLKSGEQIYSYDLIYILYRSKDTKYILFERIF